MNNESVIDRQATNLVHSVLRRVTEVKGGGTPEPEGETERSTSEEKREVQIGKEIYAIIGIIRDVNTPESRQHAYDKIDTLAQELIDMHTVRNLDLKQCQSRFVDKPLSGWDTLQLPNR
jgi:hypothetical protein